ncbi:MAG: peptide chain release factor H [Clostridiales bacterium]|jgi:peptide chain release factor|nr:peptide chain release factor H [Clostridiales bacterium]
MAAKDPMRESPAAKEPAGEKRIMLQLSSGQGPDECELAVTKLFEALCREHPDIVLIDKSPARREGCHKSIRFWGGSGLAALEGTVQWICQSPFRPKHRRKNWFVDVSVGASAHGLAFDEGRIRFESFRSPGSGGQHVNKTESGVRAVYEPTGDSAIATDERSQRQNKQIAVARLRQAIEEKNRAMENAAKNKNWLENYKIVRGNPVRIYEGADFKPRGAERPRSQ